MAGSSTGKVLCRYYISNCCTKGNDCPFSHNFQDSPDNTCRYYLKGLCVYGNSCRYQHRKPGKEDLTTQKKKPKETTSLPKIPGPVSLAAAAGLEIIDSGMVKLSVDPSKKPHQWVNAPEFIPGSLYHGNQEEPLGGGREDIIFDENSEEYFFSYSDITTSGLPQNVVDFISTEEASNLLCPFYEMTGNCPWNDECEYTHGELCDMCFKYCLHPSDPNQQKLHKKKCVSAHEEEMKKAFAVQRSEGQVCGICMEVVIDKPNLSDRRFGILSDCDHCFCLSCVRKWRNSTHTSKKIIRACPMCRKISYLVIPSEVWIYDKEEKQMLLAGYKSNLCEKPCKYFNQGKGTCPFNDSCLYQHAFPDGTLSKTAPRLILDEEGLSKQVNKTTLWDFLEERQDRTWSYWTDSSSDNDWS